MNIHETHNEYICDEVIRKHIGKILGCKIQDSERRNANGTGEGIQKVFESICDYFSRI